MRTFARILVPIDFSPCTGAVVEVAAAFSRAFGARLDLVHIWQPPYELGPVMPALGIEGADPTPAEAQRHNADLGLEALARKAEAAGARAVGVRLEPGSPTSAIVRLAAEGYDLIVMGTHGRSGLTRALVGSVAESVVRRALIPVLIVRAPPHASPGESGPDEES